MRPNRKIKLFGLRVPLWALAALYLVLLIASWIVERDSDYGRIVFGQRYAETKPGTVTVDVDTTGLPVKLNPLPYTVIIEGPDRPDQEPVLLLHGTPGAAIGFDGVGAELANRGRRAIYLDLPGFMTQTEPMKLFGGSGSVYSDYSESFYADLMLRVLDALGEDRVHVVGWSNGGAAALWMARRAPERVASVTLLASVGAQSTEGSGDYWFEHAKYAFGYAALVWAADLVPTFGILGPPAERHAFLRNFWDTDQRPLSDVMRRLGTPTLILHGRHDFLTPDWGAERHHELMPSSRLVMTPYDHFLPFLQPSLSAERIEEHASRHDELGVEPLTDTVVLGEPRAGGLFADFRLWLTRTPYWVALVALAVIALIARTPAVAIAALLVGVQAVDLGVAIAALTIGGAVRTPARGWLWLVVRTLVAVGLLWIPVEIAEVFANGFTTLEAVLVLVAAACAHAVLGPVLAGVWTWRGRQEIKARARRAVRHEYWHPVVFYAPLAPYVLWLALRHRGLMTFACCNPGIGRGGGLIGESKDEILRAMRDEPGGRVLEHAVIAPGDLSARLEILGAQIERLGGYPVILKPDAGQRGDAVKLVRDAARAESVLAEQTRPMIAQRYHPGPGEIGLLWVREPGTERGRIYGITRKEFPEVTGDGVRTIERLVLGDRRFRAQARVFRERFGDEWSRVPAEGEPITLASSGNHAQGVLFRDGEDLITPELEEAVAAIALSFEGGFDFGRFDLRYETEADLRAGRFGVIELNGTTSESTNLYDPDKSVVWSYGVLFGQWRAAYEIGAWRRKQGVKPPSVLDLMRWSIAHRRARTGSTIAD